jgi:deazaflavin-dependent oxidoreductase (nitroreductase family)
MPIDPGEEAWNQQIIDNFREHAGKVTLPPFVGANLLLLKTTGAKSGEERIAPLGFTRDGDSYVVVGSNSGYPTHSAWVRNVNANPIVTVDIGPETFPARAAVTTGAERKRLWAHHIAEIPAFADYERMVDREIPVVTLERLPAG